MGERKVYTVVTMRRPTGPFHSSAGTDSHGMYNMKNPSYRGTKEFIAGTKKAVKAVSKGVKAVAKSAARRVDKVMTGVENRMKRIKSTRVERNTSLLKSQGHTWDSYNRAMSTPAKKK